MRVLLKRLYYCKWFKIAELAAFLSAVALILALILYTSDKAGPSVCLLHRMTGLYCFGCGMTRAVRALLHGQVITALDYNLFSVAIVLYLFFSFFCYFYWRFTGKSILPRFFYNYKLYLWALAALMLFAVLRNIPVLPFSWLAP